MNSTADFGSSVLAIVIGVTALVVTATTAFVELQDDLDRIWKAEPRTGNGIVNLIRSRLLSFGMVLFIGFLLAVSLVLSAAVAALGASLFSGAEVLRTRFRGTRKEERRLNPRQRLMERERFLIDDRRSEDEDARCRRQYPGVIMTLGRNSGRGCRAREPILFIYGS